MNEKADRGNRKIVDIHCHVLPGLDDGPRTMKDALAILSESSRQGIGTMIATPHFHPGRYVADAGKVLPVLARVQKALDEQGIPLRLVPGQECYYYTGLLRDLERGDALTMAGSSAVLVEFDPEVPYTMLCNAARELSEDGYRPIIAHFERYRCLNGRRERLAELRESGAMLQLNFDRLLDRDNLLHRNAWRRLLKAGEVDFLGSDTHGMHFRPLHAKKAVQWLKSAADRETVKRILVDNPQRLLSGRL